MNKGKVKMKKSKKIIIFVIVLIVVGIASAGGVFYCTFFPNPLAQRVPISNISKGTMSVSGKSDVLIAYFSLTNNRVYTNNEVDAVSSASLKISDGIGYGHAELLAIISQETTGGDVFPIKVCDLYPETYNGVFERNRREKGSDSLPRLAQHLKSIDNYKTIILIYPNWLNSIPKSVLAFLTEYDFSGKTIVPIATSQALGLGSGPAQIRDVCRDTVVTKGLSAKSEKGVKDFLTKAGLSK